jgi:hypothetical protein
MLTGGGNDLASEFIVIFQINFPNFCLIFYSFHAVVHISCDTLSAIRPFICFFFVIIFQINFPSTLIKCCSYQGLTLDIFF